MVKIVGVAKSEHNKVPIFMSYNPFLVQTKGGFIFIIVDNIKIKVLKTAYYYDIIVLYHFYTQMSLVGGPFLCA